MASFTQQLEQQTPQGTTERILNLVRSLHRKTEDVAGAFEICLNTLLDVVTHLIEQPLDGKFNIIDSRDQAFIDKVGRYDEAIELLCIVGYEIQTTRQLEQNVQLLVIKTPNPYILASAKVAITAALCNIFEMEDEGEEDVYVEGDDEGMNEDLCGICDEDGDLICCDACPKAYHLQCVMLHSVPEGDWFCHDCMTNMSMNAKMQQQQMMDPMEQQNQMNGC